VLYLTSDLKWFIETFAWRVAILLATKKPAKSPGENFVIYQEMYNEIADVQNDSLLLSTRLAKRPRILRKGSIITNKFNKSAIFLPDFDVVLASVVFQTPSSDFKMGSRRRYGQNVCS